MKLKELDIRLHPIDFSNDLIDAHKDIKKLMPLIHLPVQVVK